ncbi:hypothetical protein OHB26_27830 [Nocardia sp. NBC_01503]|nr:hypothetical protein [Nocardia sp. NBC_01503]WTL30720.1 hypothetical protein OHB26_27830 [Nocardia sp. NBC_01503]
MKSTSQSSSAVRAAGFPISASPTQTRVTPSSASAVTIISAMVVVIPQL